MVEEQNKIGNLRHGREKRTKSYEPCWFPPIGDIEIFFV